MSDKKQHTTEPASLSEHESSNLLNMGDILHDISMNFIVEMGRKKLKISELLNLEKGSIVELDRQSDEPLDIYANDKLIATGKVILVNGKFCVKIL